MDWKGGPSTGCEGHVGHARRSLDSFFSYFGTVPLLRATVEVETMGPQITYEHTQMASFFLLS